ncbi:MAG: hypothetical protein IPK96_15150 [Flammeovirgaceae bacterium]|jgi:hypothetical protein|nr:hypothetical protein [Flammeovirgaceae bacterium]
MTILKQYWPTLVGVIIGLGAGYLYWQQIGCVTGSCPITSRPLNSSLYGGLMGGLLFSMFQKEKNKI